MAAQNIEIKIPQHLLDPQEGQPPVPMNGNKFVPAGEWWLDPTTKEKYESNGHGYFEGLNGLALRERPEIPLVKHMPTGEDYSRLLAFAQGHNVLPMILDQMLASQGVKFAAGKGPVEGYSWLAHDNVEYEIGGDTYRVENLKKLIIDMAQLGFSSGEVCQVLNKRNVEIFTERHKIEGQEEPQCFFTAVRGYTVKLDGLVREEFVVRYEERMEQEREAAKAGRKKGKKNVSQTKAVDITALWGQLIEQSIAGGLSDKRATELLKEVCDKRGIPVQVSEEIVHEVRGLVEQEVKALKAKPQQQETQAPEDEAEIPMLNDADEQEPEEQEKEQSEEKPETHEETKEAPADADVPDVPQVVKIGDYLVNTTTGEVIGMAGQPPEEEPEDQDEQQPEEPKFDLNYANWVVGRIRMRQLRIENAKRQYNSIKARCENAIKGLMWRFSGQVADVCKPELEVIKSGKKAGEYRSRKVNLSEGTVEFIPVGGLTCVNKVKFMAWWDELKDEEKVMYPHKSSIEIDEKALIKEMEDGLPLPPGWIRIPENKTGAIKITGAIVRANSKAAKQEEQSTEQASDDSDDSDEQEQSESSEESAA